MRLPQDKNIGQNLHVSHWFSNSTEVWELPLFLKTTLAQSIFLLLVVMHLVGDTLPGPSIVFIYTSTAGISLSRSASSRSCSIRSSRSSPVSLLKYISQLYQYNRESLNNLSNNVRLHSCMYFTDATPCLPRYQHHTLQIRGELVCWQITVSRYTPPHTA